MSDKNLNPIIQFKEWFNLAISKENEGSQHTGISIFLLFVLGASATFSFSILSLISL